MFASISLAAILSTVAIVTQDQASLRAAAKDSAPQQAQLWQGDTLEIRGEKLDYLQVYDHRRERAGFIKASQVRLVSLKPEDAADSLTVLRFVRDTPGAEALGISYAAAFLKAAPAASISHSNLGPEALDALGSMAERLARRASRVQQKGTEHIIAAHLESAAQYGVKMQSYEREGKITLCYDGEAYRRVLALAASAEQQARAALGLTRPECTPPDLLPSQRQQLDQWRAEVLERVSAPGLQGQLPPFLKYRLQMRRAGVWASLAFAQNRKIKPETDAKTDPASASAAQRALDEFAAVNKAELPDEDQAAYHEAALKVASVRWAAELPVAATGGLQIGLSNGKPGETCVTLFAAKQEKPLAQRCTYSVVWPASARSNAASTALALAVQPLDGWREMWLFHQVAGVWQIDALPPATSEPDLGYAEFAGWVPGSNKMLLVREARSEGKFRRSFEVLNMDSLQVENQADKPGSLSLFHRWQDAQFKRMTLSLR